MHTSEIFVKSLAIRNDLKTNADFKDNPIDNNLLPVLPFRITNKIKLIIIGQDPTVEKEQSRNKIQYTLNLDVDGTLKKYINKICIQIGVCFENIYATNLFKYFYLSPPQKTPAVLLKHLPQNLELLKEELSAYPKIPIITLGLPVLQLLAGCDKQVSYYWDYNKKTKLSNGGFKFCSAKDNLLGRDFYSLPHQPSMANDFYRNHINDYLKIIHVK